MTDREVAEAELMKMRPSTRAKFLRLMYALMGPSSNEVIGRVGAIAREKGLPAVITPEELQQGEPR